MHCYFYKYINCSIRTKEYVCGSICPSQTAYWILICYLLETFLQLYDSLSWLYTQGYSCLFFKYFLWMGFLFSTIQVCFLFLLQHFTSLHHPLNILHLSILAGISSFPKYESPFAYFHNAKYYCGQISELSLQNTVISTQSFFFIDLLFCMCFWLTAQLQRIV